MEEKTFDKLAEEYVFELEILRAKKNGLREPKKMNSEGNNGKVHCGYDIESEDRHIEVKSFNKKKTYKDLTTTQTETLLKDLLYYVYIVEYNEQTPSEPTVIPIPRADLIEMGKVKQFIRLNRISNMEKRAVWRELLE